MEVPRPWSSGAAWRAGLIVIVTLVLGACTFSAAGSSTLPGCPAPRTDTQTVDGLYVLPDDGRAPVIEEIDAARCSIDVTIYMITDEEVIEALGRARARGIPVRVLLEETPFGSFGGQVDTAETLAARGLAVKPGRDIFTFTHAKYLVIDGAVGIITNQNLTFSSFEGNREFGVVTTDPEIVSALGELFEADWNGTSTARIPDRMVVSPENSRQELTELLAGADRAIQLYVEVIRDDQIVRLVQEAAQRGVEVQLIVNPPDDDLDLEMMSTLADAGVQVRVAEHVYVHAKALVIDGDTALIGSHNPTATSIDENREISLIISDPVAIDRVTAVFAYDWVRSAPWLPSAQQHGKLTQKWSDSALALDMPIMYGYCVRTVPKGLLQISRIWNQAPELRGDGTIRVR